MKEEKPTMQRPDEKIKTGSGSDRKPSDYNPELARWDFSRRILDKSGNLKIITEPHANVYAVLSGLTAEGFDCQGLLDVLDVRADQALAIGGYARGQAVTMATTPEYIIPGMTPGKLEDKPGIIRRAIDWVTGKSSTTPNNSQQGGQQ